MGEEGSRKGRREKASSPCFNKGTVIVPAVALDDDNENPANINVAERTPGRHPSKRENTSEEITDPWISETTI